MLEGENKKLYELRVVDLRAELEKRGLDKTGNKQTLLDRLQKVLQEEGKNPESEVFEIGDKKPLKRLSTSSSSYQGEEGAVPSESTEEQKAPNLPSDKEETVNCGNQDSPIHLTLNEDENIADDIQADSSNLTENASKRGAADLDQQKVKTEEKEGEEEEEEEEAAEKVDSGEIESKKCEESASITSSANADDSSTKKSPSNPKILWITNVPKNTRANELKHLLSPCGKVVCAKVVVNARFPGSCCFGYVAMGSADDANNVIDKLNNTEFNGQIIKIDKFENVKADDLNPPRKKIADEEEEEDDSKDRNRKGEEKANKSDTKIDDVNKEKRADSERRKSLNSDRSSRGRKRSASKEKQSTDKRSTSRGKGSAGGGGGSGHRAGVLTFDKIKEERERQRMRDRERAMREDSRRRHEEAVRLKEMREITRRQRSEAERLEREREKLRVERERIEREKSELLKLERERQRIEREKLEMEKIELQRSRLRLEEDRRAVKRPISITTTFSGPRRDEPTSSSSTFDDRKRSDRHFPDATHTSSRFDPPPHSRGGGGVPSKKFAPSSAASSSSSKRSNYDKHDSFPEKRVRDFPSNLKYERNYDRPAPRVTQNIANPPVTSTSSRSTKDSRYNIDRDHYRSTVSDDRDRDRHLNTQNKTSDRVHHSFTNESNGRFDRSNWSQVTSSQPKSFTSSGGGGAGGGSGGGNTKGWSNKSGWRSENVSDRWSSGAPSSNRTSSMNQTFSGGNSNLAPACPPPPGINNYSDRFDYNKSSGIRKY